MNRKFLFAFIFILVAGGAFASAYAVDPQKTSASMIPFEVRQGEGASDIAERLQKEGVISSKMQFMLYSAVTGAFKKLKPGLYSLAERNVPAIVRTLTKGPQEVRVILFPGMTVAEMDKTLYEKGIIKRHELEKLSVNGSLEGYLLPDTYNFQQASDPRTVVNTLRKNFDAKTSELLRNTRASDISRVITIASLIEKEVADSQERKIVSGIIYKRLYDKHPLQIDAAVAYGACNGTFVACATFSGESFKQDTPYNTYTNTGLPPHPIANPSLDAIDAALHPVQTDYYFYLTDRSTGTTHFSKTFAEHTAKREKYMK
jgi:UPF0755 protein